MRKLFTFYPQVINKGIYPKENKGMKQFMAAFAVVRRNIDTDSEYLDLASIDKTEGGAMLCSHYRDGMKPDDVWFGKNPIVRKVSVLIKEQ